MSRGRSTMSDETRTTSSTGGQKGTKLARFDLIPTGPLTELAQHYGRGARKYADHQWRKGYEWSKSYAALTRHLTDFWAGKDYDVCSNDPDGCSFETAEGEVYEPSQPDTCYNHTGSHHMAAVAWHAFLLLEFKDRFPEHDDRYVPEEEPDSLDRLRELLATPAPWEVELQEQQLAARVAAEYGPDLLAKRQPAPEVPPVRAFRREDGTTGFRLAEPDDPEREFGSWPHADLGPFIEELDRATRQMADMYRDVHIEIRSGVEPHQVADEVRSALNRFHNGGH